MNYYWNDGFYIDEFHFQRDDNGDYIVPPEYKPITEAQYNELLDGQANGLRIVTGEDGYPKLEPYPEPPLDDVKAQTISTLWNNYKSYQTRYIDAESLMLANQLASSGSANGKAIQQWVADLWAAYYTVRDSITAAESAEAVRAIELQPAAVAPPCTVRELNDELH